MKHYIESEICPYTKQELIIGIRQFWRRKVTIKYCNKKINHLGKVITKAIALAGTATGF